MIDPGLADPARRYSRLEDRVVDRITRAIGEAERFHTQLLSSQDSSKNDPQPYYHPNTYAFYGADKLLKAYGQIRWVAREPSVNPTVLTPSNVRTGQFESAAEDGAREVRIGGDMRLRFSVWPEDAHGDETVPVQSGAGPTAYIRQTFAPAGFRHQESFQPETMRLLIRHLIVKIVQDIR